MSIVLKIKTTDGQYFRIQRNAREWADIEQALLSLPEYASSSAFVRLADEGENVLLDASSWEVTRNCLPHIGSTSKIPVVQLALINREQHAACQLEEAVAPVDVSTVVTDAAYVHGFAGQPQSESSTSSPAQRPTPFFNRIATDLGAQIQAFAIAACPVANSNSALSQVQEVFLHAMQHHQAAFEQLQQQHLSHQQQFVQHQQQHFQNEHQQTQHHQQHAQHHQHQQHHQQQRPQHHDHHHYHHQQQHVPHQHAHFQHLQQHVLQHENAVREYFQQVTQPQYDQRRVYLQQQQPPNPPRGQQDDPRQVRTEEGTMIMHSMVMNSERRRILRGMITGSVHLIQSELELDHGCMLTGSVYLEQNSRLILRGGMLTGSVTCTQGSTFENFGGLVIGPVSNL